MTKGMQFNRRIIGVLCVLFFVLGCSEKPKTPQQEIQEFIHNGIRAVESNKVSEVLPLISKKYKDAYNRDYDQMKSLAFFVMRRGQVTLFIEKIDISIKDKKAHVACELIGLQGKHEKQSLKDFLPQSARRWSLELDLVLEQKKWKLNAMTGDGFHYLTQ